MLQLRLSYDLNSLIFKIKHKFAQPEIQLPLPLTPTAPVKNFWART
jgi:hypothetical protein